jgi:transmembrane carrier protein
MLAGGIGGTTGDILMHSLDTVKTRQQADPHFPPKYSTMLETYAKIFRQEGIRKGLYGGVEAAMLGSFPGTVVFFGAYEYCKRHLIDYGINPSISYLAAGSFDLYTHAVPDLLMHLRVRGGFRCLHRLCPFRSPQNSPATPGTLQ